ncbi:MAG: hypothetical protein M3209_00015 [Acidobacteriota bacterium]|nr:hypothetical protein [Acidobacteriota bacterium]
MKIIVFTFLLLLFIPVISKAQESKTCSASPQSIIVRGFKLGMTETEVKRRFPKISIWEQSGDTGLTYVAEQMSSSSFRETFTEADREGISAIDLNFIEKKLARIAIKYTGFTEWKSITEFTDAIAKSLKLPLAINWQKLDDEKLRVSCNGFFAEVHFTPKLSPYILQAQSLTLSISDYENILKQREQTKNERQKQVFKP